jgi:hypothetical protein
MVRPVVAVGKPAGSANRGRRPRRCGHDHLMKHANARIGLVHAKVRRTTACSQAQTESQAPQRRDELHDVDSADTGRWIRGLRSLGRLDDARSTRCRPWRARVAWPQGTPVRELHPKRGIASLLSPGPLVTGPQSTRHRSAAPSALRISRPTIPNPVGGSQARPCHNAHRR